MKCVGIVIWVLAAILGAPMTPASGQMITTACTSSLISSFTPCLNFLSGSTNDGGSPTAECCRSVASLVSSSTECACLILTGNVPFSLPITRTLAILLPRLCRSPVPLQCTGLIISSTHVVWEYTSYVHSENLIRIHFCFLKHFLLKYHKIICNRAEPLA